MPAESRRVDSIAAAVNALAFDVYDAFSGARNLVLAPIGVYAALRILAEGAKGETLEALVSVLRDDPKSGVAPPLGELVKLIEELTRRHGRLSLVRKSGDAKLSIAMGLWVQSGYPCNPEFLEAAQSALGTVVEHADFQGQPAQAVKTINEWIKAGTRGHVARAIDSEMLHPLTRAILANTLYFKARWREVFDGTSPGDFHRFDGSVVTADFMNGSFMDVGHMQTEEVVAVELPYRSPAFSMWVIWPSASGKQAFVALEKSLAGHWAELATKAVQASKVWLTMPEFCVRAAKAMDDRDLLPGLGPVFDQRADFSGISSEPGFRVDRICQNAYISVDRFGTEAAAATHAGKIGALPIFLFVDRPFLFAIIHNPSRALLFLGKVVDPTESGPELLKTTTP